ncbi:hypothetical protein Fuma_03910 [Fuerstiella marisgermanici]|uniref:DUF4129 domain-containing protein n=2 Tax=Fuerstiella marisgermanici TaxID=1891926 RepID=A0A1P8WJP3_9PLAN|nr:hypothetical protein Fuma_03910 [Fuerstiella marisgermanici]
MSYNTWPPRTRKATTCGNRHEAMGTALPGLLATETERMKYRIRRANRMLANAEPCRIVVAGRRWPICLVAMMLLASLPAMAFAQPRHSSHRRLELPQNGTSDIQRQMQLLQQLQSLVGKQDDAASDATPPKFSPEQLKRLNDLMQQFGGKIPEGLMPDPKDVPPELMSEMMSNPQARQQIQKMLEQYARDRRLPQGNPSGSNGVLPPSTAPQPQIRQPRTDQPRTDTDQPRSDQQENQPQQNGTAPSGQPRSRSRSQVPNGEGNAPQAMPPFDQFQPDDMPASTNRMRPNGQSNRSQQPEMPSLEELRDRIQNKFREFERWNPEAKDSGTSPTLQPHDTHTDAGEIDIESVSDFLKKFKDVAADDLPPPATLQPDTQPEADTQTDSGNRPGAPPRESDQAQSADLQKSLQDAKRDLARNGLQQTLKNIVREAQAKAKEASKRQAAGGGASDAAGDAGLRDSLLRSLSGMSEKIVEIAKDAKFKQPSPSSRGQDRTTRTGRQNQSNDSGSGTSTIGQLKKSAGNFISGLAATPPTAAAQPPAGGGSNAGGSVAGGSTWLILVVLAVFAVVFGISMGVLRSKLPQHQSGRQVSVSEIRSKADVIAAFHQMAFQPPRTTEPWWTHQKVVDDLTTQPPVASTPARELGELYEQARYLPDEADFTPQQIQTAREALARYQQ